MFVCVCECVCACVCVCVCVFVFFCVCVPQVSDHLSAHKQTQPHHSQAFVRPTGHNRIAKVHVCLFTQLKWHPPREAVPFDHADIKGWANCTT